MTIGDLGDSSGFITGLILDIYLKNGMDGLKLTLLVTVINRMGNGEALGFATTIELHWKYQ